MRRAGRHPRVGLVHQGPGQPSRAELWLLLEGKREDIVTVELGLADLLKLAEQATLAARILHEKGQS